MAAINVSLPPSGDGQSDWAEYRRLVIAELERLGIQVEAAHAQGVATQLVVSQTVLATQLAVTQAVNDAKQSILDKLRETVSGVKDDSDRKLKEVETRHDKTVADLKKDIVKQEKELAATDKKLEKATLDLTTLKTKAMMLGAGAGFLMALVGLLATLFLKK